ncbi:MAG: Ribonuclease P protein component [Tenericutes bacterium ADurb.Bin087]|nr:MAG: Ribonuclease P protein component [Tenericutes bacterium ADurb.Bin087]
MKREHRILKNEQFQAIIKNGVLTKTPLCYGYFTPNELETLRVGVAVSKKIGNAVTRNKIKRQIKAIVRPYIKTHTGDFIIVAKKEINNSSFGDLVNAIAKIFDNNGD